MELNFINWLQSFNTPFLDQFFIYVTMLGEEYFYIFMLGLFYWCVNKESVRYLVIVLTFSAVVNSAMKEIFNTARPFQVESVRALRTETAHGSSFPSGHTQTVVAFYGALAYQYKRAWLWVLAVVVITMVGLSRIYLGVHWPRDVIGALFFGILSIALITQITKMDTKKGVTWPYLAMVVAVVFSMVFLHSETYMKASGAFLGFMMGYFVEDHYIKFDVRASLFQQIAKFAIGIVGTLVFYEGLKMVLPTHLFFTWLRYFVTIFFVVAGVPWLFIKLKLSQNRLFK